MDKRTWNLKLTATGDRPATTLEGVSHDDAAKILRGLMYGAGSAEYPHVETAVAVDRHEGPLAA